jgi:hypothetical protein
MSDHEPIPGSVFNPRQVRVLKIVVIVLSVLLLLGLVLLVFGFYREARKLGREEPPASREASARLPDRGGDISLDVPAGAQIERIAVDGGRVVLHLRGPEGEQVIVVDPESGGAVTRLRLNPR